VGVVPARLGAPMATRPRQATKVTASARIPCLMFPLVRGLSSEAPRRLSPARRSGNKLPAVQFTSFVHDSRRRNATGKDHANAAVRPNITASTVVSLGLRIVVLFTTCLPPRRHGHDNAYRCPAALLARQKQASRHGVITDRSRTAWRRYGDHVEAGWRRCRRREDRVETV